MEDGSISLNKYISSTGICSRRKADKLIEAGRVKINGSVAKKGNRVLPKDTILLDGKKLSSKKQDIYIALNKPIGIVSTTDAKEPNNIIDFVGHRERLFPIGRLDKASQGLILLTNDGDIVNKILRAGNKHEKEYVVKVDKPITKEFLHKLRSGVPILGSVTKKCRVSQIDPYTFDMVLIEGKNRQIRRMCEYLGYDVKSLKRVRIMDLTLKHLKVGQWRKLTPKEVSKLQKSVSDSKKTV